MARLSKAVVLAIAAFAAGGLAVDHIELPDCANACWATLMTTGEKTTGCDSTDTDCLCNDTAMRTLGCCIAGDCTGTNITDGYIWADGFCSGTEALVLEKVGCSSSASSSGSDSGSSSAASETGANARATGANTSFSTATRANGDSTATAAESTSTGGSDGNKKGSDGGGASPVGLGVGLGLGLPLSFGVFGCLFLRRRKKIKARKGGKTDQEGQEDSSPDGSRKSDAIEKTDLIEKSGAIAKTSAIEKPSSIGKSSSTEKGEIAGVVKNPKPSELAGTEAQWPKELEIHETNPPGYTGNETDGTHDKSIARVTSPWRYEDFDVVGQELNLPKDNKTQESVSAEPKEKKARELEGTEEEKAEAVARLLKEKLHQLVGAEIPKDRPKELVGTDPKDRPKELLGSDPKDRPKELIGSDPDKRPRELEDTERRRLEELEGSDPKDRPKELEGTDPKDRPRELEGNEKQKPLELVGTEGQRPKELPGIEPKRRQELVGSEAIKREELEGSEGKRRPELATVEKSQELSTDGTRES